MNFEGFHDIDACWTARRNNDFFLQNLLTAVADSANRMENDAGKYLVRFGGA